MTIRLLFDPRDLWIGVYWKSQWEGPARMLILYVCIVPCLPMQVSVRTKSLV